MKALSVTGTYATNINAVGVIATADAISGIAKLSDSNINYLMSVDATLVAPKLIFRFDNANAAAFPSSRYAYLRSTASYVDTTSGVNLLQQSVCQSSLLSTCTFRASTLGWFDTLDDPAWTNLISGVGINIDNARRLFFDYNSLGVSCYPTSGQRCFSIQNNGYVPSSLMQLWVRQNTI